MNDIKALNQKDKRDAENQDSLFKRLSMMDKGSFHGTTSIFLIFNLFLTLSLAIVLNIWFDEAYSLDTTSKTLEYAFSQAIGFEEQAPLYFVFLFLWRQIHDSIIWARLFSVGCVTAIVALTPHLSRLYLKGINPMWLTAIVAFNPFLIWMALEIRLYALSTLLATILLLLFHYAYLCESPKRVARLLYVGVALIGVYTHYFIGVLLIANGVLVLTRPSLKTKAFLTYLGDMIFVGLCFIPMALRVIRQLANVSDNTAIATSGVLTASQPSWIEFLLNGLKKSIGTFFFYSLPGPTPESWPIARLSIFCLFSAWVVRWRRSIKLDTWRNWGLVILILSLFVLVFTAVGQLHFRHANVLLIPALIAWVTVFQLPQGVWQQRSLAIGTSTLLVLSVVCLSVVYSPLAKKGDSQRVATYLMDHEQSQQPILVFNSEVEMVLTHYYKGVNTLIPLPKKEDFTEFSVDDLVLTQPAQITEALNQQAPAFQDLWLVTDAGVLQSLPSYEDSYRILDNFVADGFQTKIDESFYGARIRLLEPK